MDAGRYDRRVTIKRNSAPTDDGYTTTPGALETLGQRWAAWKPANGNRIFENQGREAKAGGTFWMRWDSDVTGALLSTDIITFEGRDWIIVSINQQGRREGVEVTVTAAD